MADKAGTGARWSPVPRSLLSFLVSAILLTTTVLVLSQAGAAQTYEEHQPIQISGNQDLVAPDQVSGNGVRGGSGTESDPYRIANWRIQTTSSADAAIQISNVDAHVLIRDVKLVTRDAGEHALDVAGTVNLQVEDVASRGNGALLRIQGSTVEVRDVEADQAHRFECGTVDGSDVTVRNLALDGPCGSAALNVRGSTFQARNVTVRNATGGFHVFEGGDRFLVDGLDARAPDRSLADESGRTSSQPVETFLQVGGQPPSEVELVDARVRGYEDGCLALGDAEAEPARPSLRLANVTFRDCGGSDTTAAVALENVRTEGTVGGPLRIEGGGVGVRLVGSEATMASVDVRGTETGLQAVEGNQRSSELVVEQALLAENGVNAEAEPPNRIVLENARWTDDAFRGNVVIRNGTQVENLDGGSEDDLLGVPLGGLPVALAIALAVGTARRTTRP